MEEAIKQIEIKQKLAQGTCETLERAIERRNITSIERHKNTIRKTADEIYELKVKVQEIRIGNGDEASEIKTWTDSIELELERWDSEIAKTLKITNKWKQEEEEEAKLHKQEIEAKARHEQFEQQLEFDRTQMDLKLQHEIKLDKTRKEYEKARSTSAKLPKLVITPFHGTHLDWLRFWNQFECEIDKADVAAVTKFSYLKELVGPKVKSSLDGLPFSTEGYERAKNILKTKYGDDSEIVNAYVQNLMNLPTIQGTNPGKIHTFYDKLVFNVQSLETLGKLKEVNGYVRMTLDKLEGIRGDLVRTDDGWRQWDFVKLVDALRKWTERNPTRVDDRSLDKNSNKFSNVLRTKTFQTRQHETKQRRCVYCNEIDHMSINCPKLVTSAERKKYLSDKRLCFNCTGADHRASDCRSRFACTKCKRRHHTSICDAPGDTKPPAAPSNDTLLNTATCASNRSVVYPVVVVNINGVKCRALIDTGAGSSYASSALLDKIKAKPQKREMRRIEMMFGTSTNLVGIYALKISDAEEKFYIETEVTRVERSDLLTLDNPKYQQLISNYNHLQGVTMQDRDTKDRLPVHVILGTGDYAKIKTSTKPRLGSPGEPIAELTKFGWTIMSPGGEKVDLNNMLLTQVHREDYEQLCRLDVLGLQDTPTGDQENVYSEFKEQLSRSEHGWYETNLPWKGNHPPLPSNESGSLKRLNNLVKRLQKQGILERYDGVIQEQINQGIVEKVEAEPQGREIYIPHKEVIKETSETTKLRIVYDASAREHENSPSLNECLETGPPLQNHL
ncbi:uncharacterized protein LOC114539027 [Dendronephthya gigantea]|uniref:uncharacterized protein LOC114539027 n=1 Tax=Dendronephthya gigantea TaxID=151771 RepID=UPI00106D85CB|nr:uncharacterized protein LOC114539027 [Dendronephthya gigantea]